MNKNIFKRKLSFYWKKAKPSLKVFGGMTWTLSKFFIVFAVAAVIGVGAVGAGITIGAIHDVPEFDPELLERPTLPSYIYDRNGVLITEIQDTGNRIPITFDQVPEHLLHAFLAAEDANFFEHPGFDISAILRAAITGYGGGSTITQQLSKQVFVGDERSIRRKLQEVYIALKVERQYDKYEIFEFYVNLATFYGNQAYGIEAAARTYFGKSVGDLTLAEAALLAGIPNWPERYAPSVDNLDPALARRKDVLWRMMDKGFITREEYDEANEEPINLVARTGPRWPFPHYIDSVVSYFAIDALMATGNYETRADASRALRRDGLHVYTAMDSAIQQHMQDVIFNPKNRPSLITYTSPTGAKSPQVGSVIMDARTGHVYGIVGGWEYTPGVNTLNRAHLAFRQPGSSIKPVIAYGPGFETGVLGTGSILDDAPKAYPGDPEWTPENASGNFMGLVSVREALIHSTNLPAIEAFIKVGPRTAVNFATKLINPVRANSWGTAHQTFGSAIGGSAYGVSPLQMARAFTAFANKGSASDPIFVTKIVDRDGNTLYEAEIKREVVMSEETAWMVTDILREAVIRGTGRFSNIPARYNFASKTGTTDNFQDRWVVGYNTEYVFSLWIGNERKTYEDENGQTHLVGPLMGDVHRKLHDIFGSLVRNTINNPTPFHPRPQGVVEVAVCSKSGMLPGPNCTAVTEYYRRGFEPTEQCNLHVVVRVCKVHGQLAGEFCPEDSIEERVFLNRPEFLVTDERWSRGAGRRPIDASLMPPTEVCTVHGPTYTLSPSPLETGVRLTWNNASLDANQGYNLYRKPFDSNQWVKVNQDLIPISTREITDNHLVPRGLAIEYRLVVVNEEGQERSIHPEIRYVRPLNAELTATYNQDQKTVALSWNRIAAEGYNVTYNIWRNGERVASGQNLSLTGNSRVSWENNIQNLPNGTYEYQVSVVYRIGNGANAKSYESVRSALRPEATITKDDDDDDGASLPFWWSNLRLFLALI